MAAATYRVTGLGIAALLAISVFTSVAGAQNLDALTLDPSSVYRGLNAVGTVTLTAAAPSGGTVVTLSSDRPQDAAVGASVTVPAGQTSATFLITTTAGTSSASANIQAALGGATRRASLAVKPFAFNVSVDKTAVTSGGRVTATLTLVDAPLTTIGTFVGIATNNQIAKPVGRTIGSGFGEIMPASQASFSFPIDVGAVKNKTDIEVTLTARQWSQTRSFSIYPSLVQSLTLSSTSVTPGTTVTGTVTLDGPAPDGGNIVTLERQAVTSPASATDIALRDAVPQMANVAAGQRTATFTFTTPTATQPASVQIRGTIYGVTGVTGQQGSAAATLVVAAAGSIPGVQTLTVAPVATKGGMTAIGTVTLASAAPASGAIVSLSSQATDAATVPSNVTIASGQTSGTFTITTQRVTAAKTSTITAGTAGGAKTATVQVDPGVGISWSFNRDDRTYTGGRQIMGASVRLTDPAPAGGTTVTLSSSDGSVTVPGSVVVSQGQNTRQVIIDTPAVTASKAVTLTASIAGATGTGQITVAPITVSKITLPITRTNSGPGEHAMLGVEVSDTAPNVAPVVTLSSSDPSVATVPASVTLAPGYTQQLNINVSIKAVTAAKTVEFRATAGGVTKTVSLQVEPRPQPIVTSLTASADTIPSGGSVTFTVTLGSDAFGSGAPVTISTDKPNAVNAPTTVTVPTGQRTATFTVASKPVTSDTNAQITAQAGGGAGYSGQKYVTVKAGYDLEAKFTAPGSIPQTGLRSGQATTLTLELKAGASAKVPSGFKVSVNRFDHTGSQFLAQVGSTQDIGEIAAGGTKTLSFVDGNPPVGSFFYKISITPNFADTNAANHKPEKFIKFYKP